MGEGQTHHVTMTRPDLNAMEAQLAQVRDELLRMNGEPPSLAVDYKRSQLEQQLKDNHARLILYARILESREKEETGLLREFANGSRGRYDGAIRCHYCWRTEGEGHHPDCPANRTYALLDNTP